MTTSNENVTLTITPNSDKIAAIAARSYQVKKYFHFLFINKLIP
jgi:hypothetical protein